MLTTLPTLLANNEEEIKAILTRVKSASEAAGLFLNISKTKILTTGAVGKIEVNGLELEVVDQYQFLGVLKTSDGSCEREIRRRIALGRVAMSSKIWRDRGITLETKVKLIKALIFPIALYGSEAWVLRKSDRKIIDAFEIWCWRRLLRIPWAARKSNVDVLKMIKANGTLEAQVVRAQLSYYGYTRRAGGMENVTMTGQMEGRRRRGRPRKRWLQGIREFMARSRLKTEDVTNRRSWRAEIKRVTRVRTRLDGTK